VPAPAAPKKHDEQSPTDAIASGAANQLAEVVETGKPAADAKNQPAPLVDVTVSAQRRTRQDEYSTPAAVSSIASELKAPSTAFQPPDIVFGSPARLHLAAERGDLQSLQAALDHLTDINSRDEAGRTALLLATLHKQTKAVTLLLAHGADPNIPDASGLTPLQAATKGGKSAIIAALKGAGAH